MNNLFSSCLNNYFAEGHKISLIEKQNIINDLLTTGDSYFEISIRYNVSIGTVSRLLSAKERAEKNNSFKLNQKKSRKTERKRRKTTFNKLSLNDILDIKKMSALKIKSRKELGLMYGVSHQTISNVILGKTYKDVCRVIDKM